MTLLSKRLMSVVGTTGAVVAAIAFTATPASADTQYNARTKEASGYLYQAGDMRFNSDGDNFRACDNWSDGAGVLGYWKVGTGGTVHSLYNGGGIGTCAGSNQDFAESATIYIKACIRDDGDVKESTCSDWVKGYADGIG